MMHFGFGIQGRDELIACGDEEERGGRQRPRVLI